MEHRSGCRPLVSPHLRILIFDGHAAPLAEARAFLECHLNVSIDVIPFYAYRQFATPRRSSLSEATFSALVNISKTCAFGHGSRGVFNFGPCMDAVHPGWADASIMHPLAADLEQSIDLVLCQFPGWQCSIFDRLRVPFAVRFTHRFDHHIPGGPMSRYLRRRLTSWASSGRAAIFTDNEFDAQYLWHLTKLVSVPWPSVGAATVPDPMGHVPEHGTRGRRIRYQWCFCCQGQPALRHTPIRSLFGRLRRLARSHGFQIEHMADARTNGTRGRTLVQSTRCTAFVVVPHSLHAYALVESYALGYPLIVPAPSLLAAWHMETSVISDRLAGNLPFHWDRKETTGFTPLTSDAAHLEQWLAHCDFVRWPYVTLMHDELELPVLMSRTVHVMRPQQREYMDSRAAASRPLVLASLLRAIERVRTPGGALNCTEAVGSCRPNGEPPILSAAEWQQANLRRRSRKPKSMPKSRGEPRRGRGAVARAARTNASK